VCVCLSACVCVCVHLWSVASLPRHSRPRPTCVVAVHGTGRSWRHRPPLYHPHTRDPTNPPTDAHPLICSRYRCGRAGSRLRERLAARRCRRGSGRAVCGSVVPCFCDLPAFCRGKFRASTPRRTCVTPRLLGAHRGTGTHAVIVCGSRQCCGVVSLQLGHHRLRQIHSYPHVADRFMP